MPQAQRFVSLASIAIAFGCVIGIAVAGCYSAFMRYDLIGTGHLPRAAIWPVMVICLVNAVVRRLTGRLALTRGEQLFVYCVILTTCAIPGQQFATYWYLGLLGPIYYATPQNRYQEFFFEHLRPWLFPSLNPDAPVVRQAFEGLDKGAQIPYHAWIGPVLVWTPLILGIFMITICLSALLRKQWVEREQLLFPLAEVPLEMTELTPDGRAAPIWRNWLMWVGFLIPTYIYTQKALHYYFPAIPDIDLYPTTENLFSTRPWYVLNYKPMNWYFDMIGITYLLTTDMGFSLWFFHFARLMTLVARTGMGLQRHNEFTQYMVMGGFVALLAFYLWVMRRHLRDIVRKAFGPAPEVDDTQEPVSYRFGFWALAVASIVVVGWCHAIGMDIGKCVSLFTVYFGGVVILTRMVSEAGLFVYWIPQRPQETVIRAIGSQRIGGHNITTLSLVGWQIQDYASNILPNALQAFKVADRSGMSQRKLFAAIAAGIVVSVFACHIPALRAIYTTTVPKTGWWIRGAGAHGLSNQIVDAMVRPQEFDGTQVRWMFSGAAFTGFLVYMRQRFLWWPFHPLGFVATYHGGVGYRYGFSIFIGWVLKVVVLWAGGTRAWRYCRPAAIGLILGNCFVLFTWLLVQNFWFPIEGVLVRE